MSTAVKVFVVLNLVMAFVAMFMAMNAYAYRENWKRRWNDDTTELARELKASADKLADESYRKVVAETLSKNLEAQLTQKQANVDAAQAQIKSLEDQIEDYKRQNHKLGEDVASMREDLATLTNTLEQTRQRNTELAHIAQVARAVAFQLNVKLAEVEDDYNNATTQIQAKDEELAKTGKDLKAAQAQMAQVREHFPDVWKTISEGGSGAFVQGVVAAVRVNPQGQQDLVMLSIGKESGVSEGMEFIVYRQNQYVVKVRAERILPDMVACRVIPNTWNTAGAKIQQGDLAQNRF